MYSVNLNTIKIGICLYTFYNKIFLNKKFISFLFSLDFFPIPILSLPLSHPFLSLSYTHSILE